MDSWIPLVISALAAAASASAAIVAVINLVRNERSSKTNKVLEIKMNLITYIADYQRLIETELTRLNAFETDILETREFIVHETNKQGRMKASQIVMIRKELAKLVAIQSTCERVDNLERTAEENIPEAGKRDAIKGQGIEKSITGALRDMDAIEIVLRKEGPVKRGIQRVRSLKKKNFITDYRCSTLAIMRIYDTTCDAFRKEVAGLNMAAETLSNEITMMKDDFLQETT